MTSDKEHRKKLIADEMEWILEGTRDFVYEHYEEEEFDPVAVDALHKAVETLAYRKKYYNVLQDRILYFPSVSSLILKADLMEEAEKYYYDDDDEWPIEYTKALKSVVRENKKTETIEEDEEEYMEKLATNVEL